MQESHSSVMAANVPTAHKPNRLVDRSTVIVEWPQGFSSHLPLQPWLVVHCHPRSERRVVKLLTKMGISSLGLFERRIRRYKGKGTQVGLVPLLGGYLFVHAGPSLKERLWQTGKIVRILEPPERNDFGQELISLCAVVTASQGQVVVRPELVPGKIVVVRHGTFAGCRGVVRRRASALELVVNIDLLGHCVAVSIAADAVEADDVVD